MFKTKHPTKHAQKKYRAFQTGIGYAILMSAWVLFLGCGASKPTAQMATENKKEAVNAPQKEIKQEKETSQEKKTPEPPLSPEQLEMIEQLKTICKEVPCRPDSPIRLLIDDDGYFETTVYASPYVYQEVVELLPGETVNFEAEPDSTGMLINLKYVSEMVHPEKTISLEFHQESEGRTHKTMMLTVNSPFEGTIRYEAGISPIDAKGIFRTSTCPVHSNVPMQETWKDPILSIHLTGFRILKADDPNVSLCD